MSCMSGSPNLNSFRDRGQVAVQLVSCGVELKITKKKKSVDEKRLGGLAQITKEQKEKWLGI